MKKEPSQEILDFLALQNQKVKNNLTVVNKEDLVFPFMLHIDKVTPKAFIPMMPRRAADSENNTVPRVTVADTLLGCLLAHAAVYTDFFEDEKNPGFIINAIDFEECLKPTAKLVYDADATNEHWLVPYDKKFLSFKPRSIGKVFVSELTFHKKKHPREGLEVLVSFSIIWVELIEAISFSLKVQMEPGYYRITTSNKDLDRNTSYKDSSGIKIDKVSKSIYDAKKKQVATLLSAENVPPPVYTKW
mgnify:CR=1 FL=1